jgi:uncharacterized protein YceH (UPF0502 family)
VELDPIDQRVLGSLLEKERTVPATYPLTLNALRTACNQTSGRNPLTDLSDRDILGSIDRLKGLGLARIVHAGTGARATKYRQVLDEKLDLTKAERAVITLLLLRGPQTPGELRARADRLYTFHEASDAEATLTGLAAREEPMVEELERQPGQKERRWAHLLGPRAAEAPAAAPIEPPSGGDRDELAWWRWFAEHLTDDSELPEVGAALDGRRWMVIEVTEDDGNQSAAARDEG